MSLLHHITPFSIGNELDRSNNKLLYRMCSTDWEQRYIYITYNKLLFRFTSNSVGQTKGFKVTARSTISIREYN